MITHAVSLGGYESLAVLPAALTHDMIPPEVREKLGIAENAIRMSVGLENVEDILADLDQALKQAVSATSGQRFRFRLCDSVNVSPLTQIVFCVENLIAIRNKSSTDQTITRALLTTELSSCAYDKDKKLFLVNLSNLAT